jgi:hypothetical protein
MNSITVPSSQSRRKSCRLPVRTPECAPRQREFIKRGISREARIKKLFGIDQTAKRKEVEKDRATVRRAAQRSIDKVAARGRG